jgi:retinol dehydrogenase 12
MSKLAIITGADGGMGTEITRAVAQAGYHVIMLCYTLFKGEERKNQLILETGNKEIEVRQVDLSSMASVTNIAEDLLGRGKHIDLLMNNAGTMSSGGLITTEDGLEYTVAVNYVAPFLLTLKLLPLMGQGTRIVNMVSFSYSPNKVRQNEISS